MPIMNEEDWFPDSVEMASERVGGKSLLVNDEFFAPKENLLKPGRGIFIEGKFTDRGKWMDGWETRRRRTPGNDWCIVKLGMPGVIHGVVVDTNHFIGNFPECFSLDGLASPKKYTLEGLKREGIGWLSLLPMTPLKGGISNVFRVSNATPIQLVRLNIFPDGGVARLRVFGAVRPQLEGLKMPVDLVALQNGGRVIACNDMFFGPKDNIILPGRAANMGEGWETRRRRGPGNDWIIIKLGARGIIKKLEIDTNHFKGNYPDRCSLDGAMVTDPALRAEDFTDPAKCTWKEIMSETKLKGHTRHFIEKDIVSHGPLTHVRLNIFPDGGVSRLRAFGSLS